MLKEKMSRDGPSVAFILEICYNLHMNERNDSKGKHIIIFGATGMVGSEVLRQALENKNITKITVIGRREINLKHEKIKQVLTKDFEDYSSVEEHMKNVDICYFCIGVYQNQVSKDDFYKITYTYAYAAAKILKENNPDICFILFSAAGAKTGSKIHWAHIKGKIEDDLNNFNFKYYYIFRPGYILPMHKREKPYIGDIFFKPIYYVLNIFTDRIGLTSIELAQAMIKASLEHPEKKLYENKDIREYLNQDGNEKVKAKANG